MGPIKETALPDVVLEVLGAHLKLPKRATVVPGGSVPGLEGILRPDLEVRTRDTVYIVLVRHRLTAQDVAMALLARETLATRGGGAPRVEPVLLGKVISPRVRELAATVGVHLFQLGWQVQLGGSGGDGIGLRARRVSSAKSWSVTFSLLRTGPTSVKALARETGLSYGWAHATVAKLLDMGVASRTAEGVSIVDVGKLLNGVAWERPLEELRVRTVRMDGKDAMEVAMRVHSALDDLRMAHAFTAWTAGAAYTGYVQRSDSVHVYLPKGSWDFLREFEDREGGIDLVAYVPDRDVFASVERVEGLTLVGPAQALLDLAGLGHAAHDLALEMARRYAGNVR